MKKGLNSLALILFIVWMATFYGCKKDEIITIYTKSVSNITETAVLTGGTVTSNEGADVIARGVCWSTENSPTVDDHFTTDGAGSGTFSSNITGLTPSTTFYVRAYATYSTGTIYGNEVTFTTPLTRYPGAGAGKSTVASFSIGTKIYLGLGSNMDYDEDSSHIYKDFWEWDPATNVWTRKADFPGNFKIYVVGFSIGTKGYIGARDLFTTNSSVTELWEYDPATNVWTQKAPLPTSDERLDAVGFSIGNKGYIESTIFISDEDKYMKDFWEWNQATNIWTKKTDFGGDIRFGAVGFSIGNKGYIGTGYSTDGDKILKDFWEWDQATDVWTKKVDLGGDARYGAVGFSIGNKGYIGTGDGKSKDLNDFWEWDQATDVWTRKADFVGSARYGAVGFSIGNKGFIGTGYADGKRVSDFWEYNPDSQY